MTSSLALVPRWIAASLAVVLLGLVVPVAASGRAAADPSLESLAGFNRIRSNRTAVMPVRLPRQASLSIEGGFATAIVGQQDQEDQFHSKNPDISITGGGRVTGVALVERGKKDWDERAMLLAVNLDFCAKPGCRSKENPYLHLAGFVEAEDGRFIIPAGDYLLYTITDGTPIAVRLRLHGLSGKAHLRPVEAARDVTVSTPADSLTEPTTGTARSYGESYESDGDESLLLTAFRLRGDSWINGHYGLCLYDDNPVPPPPLAYAYPCLGGFGVYIGDGFVRTSPYQNLFHATVHSARDGGGTWSLGGGYLAAAEVTAFDFVQLYVGLPKDEVQSRTDPQERSCAAPAASSEAPSDEEAACFHLPPLQHDRLLIAR